MKKRYLMALFFVVYTINSMELDWEQATSYPSDEEFTDEEWLGELELVGPERDESALDDQFDDQFHEELKEMFKELEEKDTELDEN